MKIHCFDWRKIMKKLLLCLLTLTFAFGLSACDNATGTTTEVKEKIYINGNVEETIEVNTTYEDKGIVYPDGYTLIKKGNVNSSNLGKYELIYSVYSAD
jgi:hypothetical protein